MLSERFQYVVVFAGYGVCFDFVWIELGVEIQRSYNPNKGGMTAIVT